MREDTQVSHELRQRRVHDRSQLVVGTVSHHRHHHNVAHCGSTTLRRRPRNPVFNVPRKPGRGKARSGGTSKGKETADTSQAHPGWTSVPARCACQEKGDTAPCKLRPKIHSPRAKPSCTLKQRICHESRASSRSTILLTKVLAILMPPGPPVVPKVASEETTVAIHLFI